MISSLLLVLFSVWSIDRVTPTFDLLEINHKLDDCGKESFVQIIAWTWSPDYCRFHCDGYRVVDCYRRESSGVRYVHGDRWHEVRGDNVRETWTENDPEIDNRKLYPMECRQWILR